MQRSTGISTPVDNFDNLKVSSSTGSDKPWGSSRPPYLVIEPENLPILDDTRKARQVAFGQGAKKQSTCPETWINGQRLYSPNAQMPHLSFATTLTRETMGFDRAS
jgi:hypothetical protein